MLLHRPILLLIQVHSAHRTSLSRPSKRLPGNAACERNILTLSIACEWTKSMYENHRNSIDKRFMKLKDEAACVNALQQTIRASASSGVAQ